MNKIFDAKNYLKPKTTITPVVQPVVSNPMTEEYKKAITIIDQIETDCYDLTQNYQQWLSIGFALSHEFGESGRELFHKVSKFHGEYDPVECDYQYTNCVNSNGSGITMGTFYHLASQAGYSLPNEKKEVALENNTMTFPKELYDNLPDFLKKATSRMETDQDKDIVLLGSITALSSCMPTVKGIYGDKTVHANLYLFVTAEASAGKGNLSYCRQLVEPIHFQLREQTKAEKQEYNSLLKIYNATKGKDKLKPTPPKEKMLFIPANNTSSGAYEILHDNQGRGLMFETEGDTLSQAFKSEHGNYSDGFRKAFHHEAISYYRRGDKEFVEINHPCLSVLLSGTPLQINTLIPSAENGLFSRFMYYQMKLKLEWKDVFASSGESSLEMYYKRLGDQFYQQYKKLSQYFHLNFTFTDEQGKHYNSYFKSKQADIVEEHGLGSTSVVRRLGLIGFRIAMVFTVIRLQETNDYKSALICNDIDYKNTLQIIDILINHSISVLSKMPKTEVKNSYKLIDRYFDQLPESFNREEYILTADELGVNHKTAEGYISRYVTENKLVRPKHNSYVKTK